MPKDNSAVTFPKLGTEGSVLLRKDIIKSHRQKADLYKDNIELRVRHAGAFAHLQSSTHHPITQEDINDYSWIPMLKRIDSYVAKQAEWKPSHTPVYDKYKYFNGDKGLDGSLRFEDWVGSRTREREEHPRYGSLYKMEIGGEESYNNLRNSDKDERWELSEKEKEVELGVGKKVEKGSVTEIKGLTKGKERAKVEG